MSEPACPFANGSITYYGHLAFPAWVDTFRAGTAGKPNPDIACSANAAGQLFGNSGIVVGAVGF